MIRAEPQSKSTGARQRVVGDTESADRKSRIGIKGWIGRRPAVCVGVAMALGVTLGWLIKRR